MRAVLRWRAVRQPGHWGWALAAVELLGGAAPPRCPCEKTNGRCPRWQRETVSSPNFLQRVCDESPAKFSDPKTALDKVGGQSSERASDEKSRARARMERGN